MRTQRQKQRDTEDGNARRRTQAVVLFAIATLTISIFGSVALMLKVLEDFGS